MQERFTVDIEADPTRLYALVSDLGTYDQWLDIVHRVEPAAAVDGDPGPAWMITLRAQLGPLARSKRLRMVRDGHDAPRQPDGTGIARFVRREHDGREHSGWTLESTVAPTSAGPSTVTMMLAYDGRLWSSVLATVLQGQVEQASTNLRRLATADA